MANTITYTAFNVIHKNVFRFKPKLHMMKSFACYGLPKVLVSDNGTRFTSQEVTQFRRGCGIKRKFVYNSLSPTGWKACTNNKECLKDCFSAQQQCTVHWALIKFLFVYHRTPHSTTDGITPENLVIGRGLRSKFIIARRSATAE